jgi:hypothetical protein
VITVTRRIIEFTSDKRETLFGWSRNCRVGAADYAVTVQRGKSVRIAFKPRGQNRGWQWHGSVYMGGPNGGRCLWSGRVDGSIGVRGLLIMAGVFAED